MNIKKLIFYFIFICLFSVKGVFFINAREEDVRDLIIFVANKEEIPEERHLRKAYFQVLLDYNKAVIDGALEYFRLYDGKNRIYNNSTNRNDDEVLKNAFNDLSSEIADDAMLIIVQDSYSPEELYEYSHMSEQLTEFFNELFE